MEVSQMDEFNRRAKNVRRFFETFNNLFERKRMNYKISIEKVEDGFIVDDDEDDKVHCDSLEEALDLAEQLLE